MKSKNIKVIDEHNIDRDANIMFAFELDGSEYVVYWISRDEESNNVFVSKVLRNIDGTYNMLNIDEDDKKKEVAEIVKSLVSSAVSDQNDKLVGVTTTLTNGKTVKFVNVSFNKEQQISVSKTYITTVKKGVTKVAETYYDVVVEEAKVEAVLTAAPAVDPIQDIFPTVSEPVVGTSVVQPDPVVVESVQVVQPAPVETVVAAVPQSPVVEPAVVIPTPVAEPISAGPELVIPTPVVAAPPVQEPVIAQPSVQVVQPAPAVVEPVQVVQPAPVEAVVAAVPQSPVVEPAVVIPTPVVQPTPVVVEASVATPQVVAPLPEAATVVEQAQPLVFNAAKETNLNAALGEVANSTAIPVENIQPIREFGVETPVAQPAPAQPAVVAPAAPIAESAAETSPVTGNAGFANSKFFMVVAIAFFLASCVFLGYEVYNYFQLVK